MAMSFREVGVGGNARAGQRLTDYAEGVIPVTVYDTAK